MLDGQVNSSSQFELHGILAFQTPVSTLDVLNQFCLVATADDVQVVDLRNVGALQKLGRVSFSGVPRPSTVMISAPSDSDRGG